MPMTKPLARQATPFGWTGRLGLAALIAVPAVGWLLAIGGLIGTVTTVPELRWDAMFWLALLFVCVPVAAWLTYLAVRARRRRAAVPAVPLGRRYHGSLETVIDSEKRTLRPIGATAFEVATRTGALLADLIAIPNVRVFHGVRPAGAGLPVVPHAISAGRRLVLVESVVWPPGCYETAEDGRIHCDGTYIGQSVCSLVEAVWQWRDTLPRGHRVSGVVIVYPSAKGTTTLPGARGDDLMWVLAADAVRDIGQCLLRDKRPASPDAMAALVAATSDRA
jgi:hypothetical protein